MQLATFCRIGWRLARIVVALSVIALLPAGALAADNALLPRNLSPWGMFVNADIVVQALTKYPSGGGDVLMGSIVTRDEQLHQQVKLTHMRLGFGIGGNGRKSVEIGRLFQIAHGGGWVAEHLPRLRLRQACGDLEQRRLAGTVPADEADAIARLHLQAGAVQKRRPAEAERDVVEFEDGRCQGSGS